MVTHSNIIHNAELAVDHLPVGVTWLPQYHDMGLIGYYLFFAMKGGTTYGFSSLDFIKKPSLWLELITRYKGTASSAPNFAYEICASRLDARHLEGLDLSSWRWAFNGGEPVSAETLERFAERFGPLQVLSSSTHYAPGLPEVTILSNIKKDGRFIGKADAGQFWHTDATYNEIVGFVNVLVAHAVPLRNGTPLGNTEFVNTQAAYVDLPEALKQRLANATAEHDFNNNWRKMADKGTRPHLTPAQVAKSGRPLAWKSRMACSSPGSKSKKRSQVVDSPPGSTRWVAARISFAVAFTRLCGLLPPIGVTAKSHGCRPRRSATTCAGFP